MSNRRAFLGSLGLGLMGLGVPGVARAWGRHRRCRPVVCTPCPLPASVHVEMLSGGQMPSDMDCCCVQSSQQIGSEWYYSAIDCKQPSFPFNFQSSTAVAHTGTCTNCTTGLGCFTWPTGVNRSYTAGQHKPVENYTHWYTDDGTFFHGVPDASIHGKQGKLDIHMGPFVSDNMTIQGPTLATVYTWKPGLAEPQKWPIALYHLQTTISVGGQPRDFYVGQETNGTPGTNYLQIHRQIDHYIQVLNPNDNNTYHVLLAKWIGPVRKGATH